MKRPAPTAAELAGRKFLRLMSQRTQNLYNVAYARVYHHEPNPAFPGVDIDAIHRRRK